MHVQMKRPNKDGYISVREGLINRSFNRNELETIIKDTGLISKL